LTLKKEKIAIYGGTFNPPHIGHIKSAEALSRAISPDRFLIIPDFIPPHKNIDAGVLPEDRLNMCRLAFSHIQNAEISDIEIKRGGRSYTSYTLEDLSSENRELYFLCGTDMLLTMSNWFRPEVIFNLATICLVRRENDERKSEQIKAVIDNYKREFSARIVEIKTDAIEISSSEIRQLKNTEKIKSLLTKPVLDYVYERGLY
jgi:nicotinate-nucleotide adenylyltransferase